MRMLEFGRLVDTSLVVEHRHSDGTWGQMAPEREHHDPADHDPEGAWAHGRIFACPSCGSQVRVSVPEGAPGSEG
jgi:hypothetical protein